MAVSLNRTGNPINREERTLINQNWDKLELGFYSLQHQINMLAGDADVEDILEAISTALERIAEVKEDVDTALEIALQTKDIAEQAVKDAQQAIEDANVAAEGAHEATLAANEATDNAKKATEDANKALEDMDNLMQEMNTQLSEITQATEDLKSTAQEMIDKYDDEYERLNQFVREIDDKIDRSIEENKDITNKMITQAKVDIQDAIDKLGVDTEALIKRVDDEIAASRQATADNKELIDTSIAEMKLTVSDAVAQGNLQISQALEQNNKDVAKLITDTNSRIDIKIGEVNTAIQNAEKATQDAIDATTTVNEAVKEVQGWTGAIEFDRNKDYFRNNVVTYNGSTWQARRNVMGITPSEDNKEDWICLAQKGVDGKGAVASVNGIYPDTNGDVKLEASDVGAYDKTEIDTKIKEVADNTSLITEELDKHNHDFLAHGGDSTFELTERIPSTRLYKKVQYQDFNTTRSELSESVQGSNIYDLVTIFTKDSEGNEKEMKYKLHFDVSGSVVKTEQL